MLIDSGAIDHVCCSLSLFVSYVSITPIHISFPKGGYSVTKYSSRVRFSDSFYLDDILFIPKFQFNILAVQHVASYLNLIFTIDKDIYVIQEKSSQRTIGLVKAFNRLYILQPVKNCIPRVAHNTHISVNSLIDNIEFGHNRLGHPSSHVMRTIGTDFPSMKYSNNIVCDPCHLGKQARLPFPHANNRT